jgi:hypothetical protein
MGKYAETNTMILYKFRYQDLLSPDFSLVYIKDAIGHESRIGREKIAIWKRN